MIDRTRAKVEAQGFMGLDDAVLDKIDFGLRVAPFLCASWTAVATALGSAWGVAVLVPIAMLGAVLPGHPFDAVYNQGLRHVIDGPPLPRYGAPRHFACGIAAVWLSATAAAFALGATFLGTVLGGLMVATALVPVTTGFCIPSWLWGKLFGRDYVDSLA